MIECGYIHCLITRANADVTNQTDDILQIILDDQMGTLLEFEITDYNRLVKCISHFAFVNNYNLPFRIVSVVEATKLSQTISDSYPELAASFNHLLESFKRDILLKKYENANLEQSYER